jgi:hypothetical protein
VVATGLLLLSTAVVHWQGYSFGGRGHSIHIPLVRWLLDRRLFPLDPITDTFEGFATWFFHGVAALVRVTGDLELAFFACYFVSLLGLVSGAWALNRAAAGSPAAGVLAALLFVSQQPSLAGESSHWYGLTHAGFAAGGLVWCLALYIGGRRLLAWALVGALFNIHALAALYVAAMLGVDGLLRLRERGARELAVGVGACALLALPTLGWILLSAGSDPIESLPLWLRIMRVRSSIHAFPLSMGLGTYGRFAMLLCLGWLGVRMAPPGPLWRHLAPFAVAVALMCLAGVVFAEWIPTPTVIRAQLVRSSKWIAYLALVSIARLAVLCWARGGVARVAGALAIAGVLLREPSWLALSLALLLLTGDYGIGTVLAGSASIAAAALGGGITAPPELGLEAVAVHFKRLLEGPTSLVCLAAWLSFAAARPGWARRVAALLVVALTLGWLLPDLYTQRHSDRRRDTWKQVQDWARENTPADALFLTPPGETGFRVFSERGIAGEWKDGTQQFFANRFAVEWWERMHALGGQAEGYHQLGQSRLLERGRRYGARHAVCWSGTSLELPRLYENADWIVYELRERPPPADPGAGQP